MGARAALLTDDVSERPCGLINGWGTFEQVSNRIPLTINEAVTGGSGDAGLPRLGTSGDDQILHVHRQFDLGVRAHKRVALGEVVLGERQARDTQRGGVTEEDFGEAATDEGRKTKAPEGLGGMLTGATTTKVKADDHDALLGSGNTRGLGGVHGVRALEAVRAGPLIAEGVFAEAIKGHATQKAGGDDAVGVDVVAGNGEGEAFDLGDFSEGHGCEIEG